MWHERSIFKSNPKRDKGGSKINIKIGSIVAEVDSRMDGGRRIRITKIEDTDFQGIDLETKRTVYGKLAEVKIEEDDFTAEAVAFERSALMYL